MDRRPGANTTIILAISRIRHTILYTFSSSSSRKREICHATRSPAFVILACRFRALARASFRCIGEKRVRETTRFRTRSRRQRSLHAFPLPLLHSSSSVSLPEPFFFYTTAIVYAPVPVRQTVGRACARAVSRIFSPRAHASL